MRAIKQSFCLARSIITFCFGISYLVNIFLKSPVLSVINFIVMVVVLAMSLVTATGSSKAISIVLLAISGVLLVYTRAPLEVWSQALQKNSDLIAMFIMIPLIGIPVQYGGYCDSLQGIFTRYAKGESRYYALVSCVTAVVGSLISIAAVPLTYEISRISCHGKDKKLLGTALTRGFITCMIWAPTSATIALVVQVTGARWIDMFPVAVSAALIALAVGYIVNAISARRSQSENDQVNLHEEALRFDPAKIVELAVFVLLLIVSIVAISWYFQLSVIVVVALTSVVWPVIWMVAIRKYRIYRKEFKQEYFQKKLPKAKNQIALFVSAGFLAQSISYSSIGAIMADGLLMITGQSVLLLTIGIILIGLLTALAGIHPIVVCAVLGAAIEPAVYSITPVYLAVILSVSWALGNAICPASANVIAVADMIDQSPVRVGPRWNGVYAMATAILLVAFITALRLVGWI